MLRGPDHMAIRKGLGIGLTHPPFGSLRTTAARPARCVGCMAVLVDIRSPRFETRGGPPATLARRPAAGGPFARLVSFGQPSVTISGSSRPRRRAGAHAPAPRAHRRAG